MRTEARGVVAALYVDRATRQWVVRDLEGQFWSLPAIDNAWDERQPFTPAEGTDLEPVPGHYKYMLGLCA
ncbi:MAG: hypothetical protein U0797_20075 [Gemmataceae bacterium]